MSGIAIQVEGLGKRYALGTGERYLALRDVLTRSIKAPAGWLRRRAQARNGLDANAHVWALKDVSFEVKEGQVLGIIGRNGAGKSTLLKILSRVTEPTTGRVEIRGRVGSLLEVGTGFHPELTGRENLFLSGAILGMGKLEIARKFDEIVAFAELERFIDTPVKFYSSGMYIRLAFGVAAHLEPDILLLDEVLAVGDAEFQRKCFDRMDALAGSGRTVLIVSHNMGAIKAFAPTTMWIESGAVKKISDSASTILSYLSATAASGAPGIFDAAHIDTNRVTGPGYLNDMVVRSVVTRDTQGAVSGFFSEGDDIRVDITVECLRPTQMLHVRVPVYTMDGQPVFECTPGAIYTSFPVGIHTVAVGFNLAPLLPGIYRGEIILSTRQTQDRVLSALQFEITANPDPDDDPYAVLYARQGHMGVIKVASAMDIVRIGG